MSEVAKLTRQPLLRLGEPPPAKEAAAAANAAAAPAPKFHPLVLMPEVQCGKCTSKMLFERGVMSEKDVIDAFAKKGEFVFSCEHCGVRVLVGPIYVDGKVVP